MDVSRMDIFCSVAIYGWKGAGGGGGGRREEEGGGREVRGECRGALTGTIYIELAPRCYLL